MGIWWWNKRLYSWWFIFNKINGIGLTENYVEILEEEKKIPEKLELPSFIEFKTMTPEERYVITAREYDVLNDLIDYLKSKGDD